MVVLLRTVVDMAAPAATAVAVATATPVDLAASRPGGRRLHGVSAVLFRKDFLPLRLPTRPTLDRLI